MQLSVFLGAPRDDETGIASQQLVFGDNFLIGSSCFDRRAHLEVRLKSAHVDERTLLAAQYEKLSISLAAASDIVVESDQSLASRLAAAYLCYRTHGSGVRAFSILSSSSNSTELSNFGAFCAASGSKKSRRLSDENWRLGAACWTAFASTAASSLADAAETEFLGDPSVVHSFFASVRSETGEAKNRLCRLDEALLWHARFGVNAAELLSATSVQTAIAREWAEQAGDYFIADRMAMLADAQLPFPLLTVARPGGPLTKKYAQTDFGRRMLTNPFREGIPPAIYLGGALSFM